MKHYEKLSRFTLAVTRVVAAVVIVMLCCFPALVQRYHLHFRPLTDTERTAIVTAFYVCGLPVLLALWRMDRLLRAILRAQLFTPENVGHIRVVALCCLAVSLVCLCAGFGFPSLLFLCVIMAFLALAVSVVASVMDAAVALREENDLTV